MSTRPSRPRVRRIAVWPTVREALAEAAAREGRVDRVQVEVIPGTVKELLDVLRRREARAAAPGDAND